MIIRLAIDGFAIGGGNLVATLCELKITAAAANMGQVGPKVGAVDGGWGTALLARHAGDNKACEIWFLSEQYSAQHALKMGLVNKVVPAAELDAAVEAWTDTIGKRSPTALVLAKRSFNADSENIRGISQMALNAVKPTYDTAESKEGVSAFTEKRKPGFSKYVKRPRRRRVCNARKVYASKWGRAVKPSFWTRSRATGSKTLSLESTRRGRFWRKSEVTILMRLCLLLFST